ncbi:MAG: ferrous iron transport protein A [Deferribacteres bacterium]|nr:ferrous iron transport protein A [Deferribacteres bacterium]
MRPLTAYSAGSRVKVCSIKGGRGVKSRLESLGLVPGAVVEVVKPAPGPVIVKLNSSRIVLGVGEAMKVYCESAPEALDEAV